MRKAKALNGFPNNMVQMYFSTHAYYRDGYMADHLWRAHQCSRASEVRIDILHGSIAPVEFETPALLSHLPILRAQLIKELELLELPPDHITEARIDILFPKEHEERRLLKGTGTITTAAGRTLTGKTYTESA